MLKTVYLVLFVGVAFVLLGSSPKSPASALVCSRSDDDFAHKAVLVVGLYLTVSLIIAFVLIHLLGPHMAGHW